MATELVLTSGETEARVALEGGELCAWRHRERELLWPGDARWWPRRCPILFPIVGRLRGGQTRVGGHVHRMGVHGFASTQTFSLDERSADRATLVLESSVATRAAYPFEFRLAVEYRAQPSGVDISLTVHNTGDVEMPFAIGLHPGLRWPFGASSSEGHAIVFEKREEPWVPVITDDGLLSRARRSVPLDACRLPLDGALFEQEALCFLQARSRSVRFESPADGAIVVSADNFAHWALWSRSGAPFLCVEAWTGFGDAPDYDGELADRPSMTRLAPGASSRYRLELRHEAARGAR